MTTQESSGGRRKSGGAGRRARPELVVRGEGREPGEPDELLVRGGRGDGAGVADGAGSVAMDAEGEDARPVGTISGGRKKFAGSGGKRVAVNIRMDPAVHFALKVLVFESGLDQQYLVNVAVRQLCKEHGLDPDAIREGKGYTVSFPGSLGVEEV